VTWQDIVFSIGGLAIAWSLTLTLRNPDARVPVSTSSLFIVTLSAFMAAFATLGLWLSAVSTAAQVGLWGLIAARRRM